MVVSPRKCLKIFVENVIIHGTASAEIIKEFLHAGRGKCTVDAHILESVYVIQLKSQRRQLSFNYTSESNSRTDTLDVCNIELKYGEMSVLCIKSQIRFF